ncbi:ABC transporter permease [Acetobacter papayae]|nr:ABC transporter permease [Acetobacter papayae]
MATESIVDKLTHYSELSYILWKKEIKVRYKNNFFGYLWSLANPLSFALVFYFAFNVVFKSGEKNFVLFLISGLFAWQWIANYIIGSCNVFVSNGSIIKKSLFPRIVLPLSLCMQDGFHYVMSIPVIAVASLYYGVPFGLTTLAGIVLISVAQFLLLFGIGLAMGTANLFFRDMEKLVGILLNILFYVTPVLYPMTKIPEQYVKFILLNPFAPLINAWHALYLEQRIDLYNVGLTYAYAVVSLIVGLVIYRRMVWRFAEVL